MSGLPLETHTSNLKSVASTVFELLAFNFQKFDPGHTPFEKKLRGHVRTHVKFEVRSYNSFKLV